jgi:hypothetical protein
MDKYSDGKAGGEWRRQLPAGGGLYRQGQEQPACPQVRHRDARSQGLDHRPVLLLLMLLNSSLLLVLMGAPLSFGSHHFFLVLKFLRMIIVCPLNFHLNSTLNLGFFPIFMPHALLLAKESFFFGLKTSKC